MFEELIVIKLIGEDKILFQKSSNVANLYPTAYKIDDNEAKRLLEWLETGKECILINVPTSDEKGYFKLALNRSTIAYSVID